MPARGIVTNCSGVVIPFVGPEIRHRQYLFNITGC